MDNASLNNGTSLGCTTIQSELMNYDPAFGTPKPYPSHAKQYRDFHGHIAWLFDPWTGIKRHPFDIGIDVVGRAIISPSMQKNIGIDAVRKMQQY